MTNDLKFSGEAPVVINYNGNTDDIYAPVRTSSCDINIVSGKILDDLYTARKDEVTVKIERDEYPIIREVVVTNYGSVVSYEITPAPASANYYTIYQKDQFFTDINGDFRFKGIVTDLMEDQSDTVLKFNKSTKTWDLDNAWALTGNNLYFTDGEYSYMVNWNGSTHSLHFWTGTGWDSGTDYLQVDGGVTSDFPYAPDDYILYGERDLECVFGKYRWVWGNSYRWYKTDPYTDADGSDYFAMYGRSFRKIKDSEGNVIDTMTVNNSYSDSGNWIVKINRTNSTFTKLIRLKEGWDNLDNLFTDSAMNVYYMTVDGVVWSWNWTAEDWIEWVTFSGDMTAGTVYLDYSVPVSNDDSLVVFKYDKSNNKREAFSLHSFNPPVATVVERRSETPVRKMIWEGYKMPNTYSQEVTLNLDQISMTCIDPVSILKYVTIDKIFQKPKIVTYREFIGKILSYVMLSSDRLLIEENVSYGGPYFGDNGLLDMSCQVANFWDESDKPDTAYEMIEELLRPFCMTLAFSGDAYYIYNQNRTSGRNMFYEFQIGISGELTYVEGKLIDRKVFDFAEGDWISNNVSNATIEINNTYDKVTGVSSTMIPTYSTMAMDLIDYTQRDKYQAGGLNVQLNKTKGIKKVGSTYSEDLTDRWFYIWNGTYVNPEYDLEPWSSPVNWYLNINKAYEYLMGTSTGYGADTGSILNFYGGIANPTGTGKEQLIEKSVEVKKKITAYAADNGVPPEFLETADLAWTYSGSGSGSSSSTEGHISKSDSSDAKFGSGIEMGTSNRIIYKQKYENINMTQTNNPVVDIDISRSFSRTGINTLIPVMNNNTATNCSYSLIGSNLVGCDTNYYPPVWNSENIVVNSIYFKRYVAGSTIRCTEIWDKRRIDLYIELTGGTFLQFNGKEWVSVSSVSENDDSNSFYLMRLMNNEYLFHTEQRYPVIETSDGEHYALGTESFVYFRDNLDHGVYDHDPGVSGEKMECPPYAGAGQIKNSSEGFISVNLPFVDDTAAVIYVDVYNSSMLGMTGTDTIGSTGPVPFYYPKQNESGYKEIWSCWCDFLPKNLSHVKAEHLDLSISVSTPESNLGQMFRESDIKYEIDSDNNYVEEFNGPSFQVNTFNQLVASSFSYLLFDNAYADPGQFVINGQAGRPECYVVQAYMNWLGIIRKIYNKTLLPLKEERFDNIMTFITSPEIGENGLMVISDSWDLKTNRHTISSIEDHNMEVDYVMTVDVFEIPRMARAERYNLPTAHK